MEPLGRRQGARVRVVPVSGGEPGTVLDVEACFLDDADVGQVDGGEVVAFAFHLFFRRLTAHALLGAWYLSGMTDTRTLVFTVQHENPPLPFFLHGRYLFTICQCLFAELLFFDTVL